MSSGQKTQIERMLSLSAHGMPSKEIAAVLNVTTHYVRGALSRARRPEALKRYKRKAWNRAQERFRADPKFRAQKRKLSRDSYQRNRDRICARKRARYAEARP